jgi:predicted GIY-YIG superfamily endonuclease
MSFWAYMLHCRGGYFYVGHTDNLELRLAQHQTGSIAGFAAEHRPVELVWSQDFPTRDEAKAAERQLKGWSREKKLALIRGNWDRISTLAKAKGSPSTSSGRTVLEEPTTPISARPELVEGLPLFCHPDTPSAAVEAVSASIDRIEPSAIRLTYRVSGRVSAIVIPDQSSGQRRDGLWQTTCFEAFSRVAGCKAYEEANFSPSTDWAAYCFSSYRALEASDYHALSPDISVETSEVGLSLCAQVALAEGRGPWHLALSAVIEETDGTKSYWALRHPPGKPDFHHPDCFAVVLEAAEPA